ncbi:hypothetical protein [Methylobacterium sp. Leaf89]|uniref:hypothetical protein n=1 Tax=Methylobacterium sp. Leaf89 TaxID=1736245 RepID=UPI0012E8533F|nr:hypothetical protein [Methylobacterium sp. Leaf89]
MWGNIRKDQKTTAYYEIFHEILFGLKIESIPSLTHEGWMSKHPPSAAYFLEYIPLIKESGGIDGFDPSFSYEKFIPKNGPTGMISDHEVNYILRLIKNAEDKGKIPVLTATRSLGRVAGIKSAAPGLHILLYRNVFEQWCSFTQQSANGNSYFIDRVEDAIHSNLHDPFVSEIVRLCSTDTSSLGNSKKLLRFFLFHLYLYINAAASADFLVDMNRVATNLKYRDEVVELFFSQNIKLDLSGANNTIGFCYDSEISLECLEETIQIYSSSIIDRCPSPSGREFGKQVVSDFLREMSRYHYYTKSYVVFNERMSTKKISLLIGDVESSQKIQDELQIQRDTAHAMQVEAIYAHEVARAEVGALQRARDEVQAQRDAALASQAEAIHAHEVARAEVEALQRARDEVQAQRDAALASQAEAIHAHEVARAEVEALQRARDEVQTQRDAALASQAEAIHAHEVARAEVEALERARDELQAQRDAALASQTEAISQKELYEYRCSVLLHWFVAYNDSTNASLSWKLTRPLRWIGLGMPQRPQRPDFLEM